MDGVHDLGGTQGFGPIATEPNEPVFHSDWEKSVFAMFPALFVKGCYNIDQFRYGIEQLHPVDYLASRYYEHWLHSFELYAERAGVMDKADLDARTQHYLDNPDAVVGPTQNPEMVSLMEGIFASGATARRESDKEPAYAVGDRVRVKGDNPRGHTRKAGYIRGKVGIIVIVHGAFIYPDSAGNDKGEDPQHVYGVRFVATELWGPESADPNSSVTFDVWEPYIEKV